MKDEAIGLTLKYIAGNWPAHPTTAETIEVFRIELGPLDFDEVMTVLREEFAGSAFPPAPMQLRKAVLDARRGGITYEQASNELLDKIASVGYAQPEPEWSHPVIGAIVRQRGGWTEVCASTPARASFDAVGMNAFNTWNAQFRDEFRIVAARYERVATHAELSGGSQDAIAMPDLRLDRDEDDDEATG